MWFMSHTIEEAEELSLVAACKQILNLRAGETKSLTISEKTMESSISWYMRRAFRPDNKLNNIRQLHFYKVTWSGNLAGLFSRGVAFSPKAAYKKLGMYNAEYDEEVMKGVLCHGMISWKLPFPSTIVLRGCHLKAREVFCLKQAISGHKFRRRCYLHLDQNSFNQTTYKVLLDMQFRAQDAKGYDTLFVIANSAEFSNMETILRSHFRGKM